MLRNTLPPDRLRHAAGRCAGGKLHDLHIGAADTIYRPGGSR